MANNEIYHNADSKSNNIDQYRRKCRYKISEFKTKIDEKKFSLPSDPNSIVVCGAEMKNKDEVKKNKNEVKKNKWAYITNKWAYITNKWAYMKNKGEVMNNKGAVMNNEEGAEISAEFDGTSFNEDKMKVKFQGPGLFSTCKISISKAEDYDREFGYIQTSKRLYEKEFENAIEFSDFHANLLHNQDEVLDSDGEKSPFCFTKSYCKVPAGENKYPTITIEFTDKPSCDMLKHADNQSSKTYETSLKRNWGCLKKHERYQQFFVYLVMRSMMDNGEWKYDVLFSFDWFIYLKWIKVSGENNNIFEYNCGLNEHIEKRNLPEIMGNYTCNDDQFQYWIDKIDCNFNIDIIPKSISKNYLERIYDTMKIMISKKKTGFEKCKIRISNANKLWGNNEIRNLEDGNDGHIENMGGGNYGIIAAKLRKSGEAIEKMYSIENKDYEDIEGLLPKVEELCENLKEMDLEKIKFLENTTSIDMDGRKYDDLNKLIDRFYEGIKCLSEEVKKLSESLKKGYAEVEKLDKDIEIVDLESKEFRENFRNIELEVKKLDACIIDSNHFVRLMQIDNLDTGVETMGLERNESSGDFTNSDEIRESLPNTERVYLKRLKEVIENSIDFGKYKICKCRFLPENEFLDKIRKAVIARNQERSW